MLWTTTRRRKGQVESPGLIWLFSLCLFQVWKCFASPAHPEQSCSTMVSTTYSTTLVTAFHHFKCHGWVRKGEGLYISCWTEDLDIFKLYSTVHKDDIEDDNYKKIRLKRQETALFIFFKWRDITVSVFRKYFNLFLAWRIFTRDI